MRATALAALGVALYAALSLPGGAGAPEPGDRAGPGGSAEPERRGQVPRLPSPGPGELDLAGDLVDASGEPVRGAEITARLELGPGVGGEPPEEGPGGLALAPEVVALSDEEGRFVLSGLEEGRHRLRVEGEALLTAEVRFVEVPGDRIQLVVSRRVEVEGRVTDRGAPVERVDVRLAGDGLERPLEATTDGRGYVSFPDLAEGMFRLWAYRGDRAAPARRIERLGEGPFEPVELALEEAAIASGRVVDRETRQGIAAIVTLTPEEGEEPPRRGRSDESGRFTIEGVPKGRWSAEAFAPGYVAAEAVSFEVGRGYEPTLTLARGGVVSGRVLSAEGAPVEGATVSVRGEGRSGSERIYDELALLSELGAAAPGGFAGVPGQRLIPRGELGVLPGPIPYPPPPGARAVRIAVPVPEPEAEREPELSGSPARASSFVTDARGRFRVAGIAPGRYRVHAAHPDYAGGASRRVSIALGAEVEGLEVTLVPGLVVRGRVTDGRGRPIVGAAVIAEPQGEGAAPEQGLYAISGEGGRYRIGPFASGVRLVASAGGHGSVRRAVPVRARQLGARLVEREVDFVLPVADADLAGRVVDPARFPVRGALVEIAPAGGPAGPGGARTARTDADGRFSIEGLTGGRYRVRVAHPGHPEMTTDAETGAGVELELPFGGGLAAEVRDAVTRAPVEGATVIARGPGGRERQIRTGPDGALDLAPLASGRWVFEVDASGYVEMRREVEVPSGDRPGSVTVRDVQLDLARGATVGGVVRNRDGERVRGARVEAGPVSARTDEYGAFRLTDVPTGEVEIRASREGSAGSIRVGLAPGDEVVTLEITIR